MLSSPFAQQQPTVAGMFHKPSPSRNQAPFCDPGNSRFILRHLLLESIPDFYPAVPSLFGPTVETQLALPPSSYPSKDWVLRKIPPRK